MLELGPRLLVDEQNVDFASVVLRRSKKAKQVCEVAALM